MTRETGAGEDPAEPSRQAQVCDTGGTVVGGGKLRGAGTPLVADLNQAGDIIGKPEANKPVVEGGCRLVHQHLTGRLIGDRDLDILIVEFPQAGREAVVEAVVGGGEIGCDRDIRLIVGKIERDFLVIAREQ